MNSCWRPLGGIPCSLLLIPAAFSFVILGSYLPALLLAATNHTTNRPIGFGCRSLSWSVIAFLWLVSGITDSFLRRKILRRKMDGRDLWIRMRRKDIAITILIIFIVLVVQVGFLNNCWCRSNVISQYSTALVNLFPLSGSELTRAWSLWVSLPVGFLVSNLGLTAFFICRHWKVRKQLFGDKGKAQEDLQLLREELQDLNSRHGRNGSPNVNATTQTGPLTKTALNDGVDKSSIVVTEEGGGTA
jgi:hypothetical protein